MQKPLAYNLPNKRLHYTAKEGKKMQVVRPSIVFVKHRNKRVSYTQNKALER